MFTGEIDSETRCPHSLREHINYHHLIFQDTVKLRSSFHCSYAVPAKAYLLGMLKISHSCVWYEFNISGSHKLQTFPRNFFHSRFMTRAPAKQLEKIECFCSPN